MILEFILAGLVAHSVNYSIHQNHKSINQTITESTRYLEEKIDQLNIKIDMNQQKIMRSLSWMECIQTLQVMGATYRGDNLFVFRENNTSTTANLATKIVTEENGDFVLYKNFNNDTEQLYMNNRLIYEKSTTGEKTVYDETGRIYSHTNLNNDTYTYLPNGQVQSIQWNDGSTWFYKYDKEGIIVSVETL